jgi:hypothetical protein
MHEQRLSRTFALCRTRMLDVQGICRPGLLRGRDNKWFCCISEKFHDVASCSQGLMLPFRLSSRLYSEDLDAADIWHGEFLCTRDGSP